MAREPDIGLRGGWLRYGLATRPGFLVASLVPVGLGVTAAAHQGHVLHPGLLGLTVLATLLVHAGINVINDYYDDCNGTDRCNTQRIFPYTGGSRMIQNGVFSAAALWRYGVVLLIGAMLLGGIMAWYSGGGLLLIGVSGLLLGWGYSAPPLQLHSRGLGELAVAVGFGSLIPLGSWFVQTGQWAAYPVIISVPAALLLMNILYINQFPDYQADAATGKRHWVVRLGLHRAPQVYGWAAALAGIWLGGLVWLEQLPHLALVSGLPLLLAGWAAWLLHRDAQTPWKLAPAIQLTIASLVGHGVLLSGVLGWSRMWGGS